MKPKKMLPQDVRWIAFTDLTIDPSVQKFWTEREGCDPVDVAFRIVNDERGNKKIKHVWHFHKWILSVAETLSLEKRQVVELRIVALKDMAYEQLVWLAHEVARCYYFVKQHKADDQKKQEAKKEHWAALEHFSVVHKKLLNDGLAEEDSEFYFEAVKASRQRSKAGS